MLITGGINMAGGFSLLTLPPPPPPVYQLWAIGGYNTNGQLGFNDVIARSSPTQIGTSGIWSRVSGGGQGTIVGLKTDGTLWAWGLNTHGALGTNDLINRSSPTQVGSDTTWSWVHSDSQAVVGIKSDGTMWTWGYNAYGSLGLNGFTTSATARSSPTQVGSLTTWSRAWIGQGLMAIKTDGTAWVCGAYAVNGASVGTSSPVQLGALTTWNNAQVSMGYSVHVIKSDGTLWGWSQGYGDLGNNTSTGASSPIQIGSNTNWSFITSGSQGQSHLAIRTDGTLWGWGYNGNAELALDPAVSYRSSPTQVGALTNWSKAVSGGIGIKTDGTLWTWGSNYYGELGQNTGQSANVSSPVQVGALTYWSDIYGLYPSYFAKTAQ